MAGLGEVVLGGAPHPLIIKLSTEGVGLAWRPGFRGEPEREGVGLSQGVGVRILIGMDAAVVQVSNPVLNSRH